MPTIHVTDEKYGGLLPFTVESAEEAKIIANTMRYLGIKHEVLADNTKTDEFILEAMFYITIERGILDGQVREYNMTVDYGAGNIRWRVNTESGVAGAMNATGIAERFTDDSMKFLRGKVEEFHGEEDKG